MEKPYRRYEMLLPRRFNNGDPVPDELFADTLLELRERFGSVSTETQVIQGQWSNQAAVYRDDLIRIFVDVPDLAEHRSFFRDYKERLKERFQQIEIWMVTYPIEVF